MPTERLPGINLDDVTERHAVMVPLTVPQHLVAATSCEVNGGDEILGNLGLVLTADKDFAERLANSPAHRVLLAATFLGELPHLLEQWIGTEETYLGLLLAKENDLQQERAQHRRN